MRLRISQLDWPRILYTRMSAILLGVAAVLSVGAIILVHSNLNLNTIGPVENGVLGVAGAAGAFGFMTLLACMAFFWLKCDSSPKTWKTIWFFVLLFGLIYGSTIVYYGFVYLPAVIKRLRHPEGGQPPFSPPELGKRRKLIGPFGWALVVGWVLLFLTVAACFTLPKGMSHLLRPIADYFVLWPASLILGSMIYAVILFFRVGVRHPTNPHLRGD